jgi:predicted AlkP superfamily phosphohydrolase/phosphomutase
MGKTGQDQKVVVIGLDGATLSLILPWAQEGKLPTFRRILENGVHGTLESVPNQRSAAAWTSFMTGKNPGKHGIFEFYEQIQQSHSLRFINGSARMSKSLWRILSEEGRDVGVINVPMTYPAEQVKGFLISGLDAPGAKSKGFTYPDSLIEELNKKFEEYILEPGLTGYLLGGEIEKGLQQLERELTQKFEVTKYLMENRPWDLFMVVFRSLDAAQHCFWKYMDPGHPQYKKEEASRYGDVILKTYQKIDGMIGWIEDHMGDGTLLILSDHGFGRKHPATAQINAWLEEKGFLCYEWEAGRALYQGFSSALAGSYRFIVGHTPRWVKEALVRCLPALRNDIQSRLCFSGIDWFRTTAYSDSLFPTIWINKDHPGHEEICGSLIKALHECEDAQTGDKIVQAVFRREEIYMGPYVEKAPDLLIRWQEDIDIHGIKLKKAASRREIRPFIPGEDHRVISGDHRLHGVFMGKGPQLKKGFKGQNMKILDLAPTILYLMGLVIPTDMDGRVLSEVLDESFIASSPPRYKKGDDRVPGAEMKDNLDSYTDEDAEAIASRLRGLGYLE